MNYEKKLLLINEYTKKYMMMRKKIIDIKVITIDFSYSFKIGI